MPCLSSERERLRRYAEHFADALAERIAAQISSDPASVKALDENSPEIRQHVAGIALDPVLRMALARICVQRAKDRLRAIVERR